MGKETTYRTIDQFQFCVLLHGSLRHSSINNSDYLMENSILNNFQWGFRSAHITALALIDCTNNWLIGIDNGKISSTILLDVKKAFDTIGYDILLRKLSHYGISNTELEIFRSYLCNRLQCCSVNGHTSSFKTINCGVPQGSILGHLFSSYM